MKEFCSPTCLCYEGGVVKGACDRCSHSTDYVYPESKWGIAFNEVVEILGESDTEYYLAGGVSVLKSAVDVEK